VSRGAGRPPSTGDRPSCGKASHARNVCRTCRWDKGGAQQGIWQASSKKCTLCPHSRFSLILLLLLHETRCSHDAKNFLAERRRHPWLTMFIPPLTQPPLFMGLSVVSSTKSFLTLTSLSHTVGHRSLLRPRPESIKTGNRGCLLRLQSVSCSAAFQLSNLSCQLNHHCCRPCARI
jgi:hypothetical protein